MKRREPDLAGLLCDAAAGYLASKGRGALLEQVGEFAWETLMRELLAGDPRFVEGSGGVFELVESRDSRHAALTGAA